MSVLSSDAAVGATTISLDTVAGLPTEPQFEVVIGNEVATVVEPDIIASPLTLAQALLVAHKAGERVALRQPEIGVRGELVADVRLTDDGLVIENGKIFINDPGGASVLSAAGFEGSWLDFLSYGGYNATFRSGNTNPITTNSIVGTASTVADYLASLRQEVPYWFTSSASGMAGVGTLTRTADTATPSGFKMRLNQTAIGTPTIRLVQDFPVQPYVVHAVWALMSHNPALDFTVVWSYRDVNHALVGTSIAFTPNPQVTTALERTLCGVATLPATDRGKVRYLRLEFEFQTNAVAQSAQVAAVSVEPLPLGAASATRSTNLAVAHNTLVAVTLPDEFEPDPYDLHTAGSAAFVAPETGWYLLSGWVQWVTFSASGRSYLEISDVSTGDRYARQRAEGDTAGQTAQTVAAIAYLTTGDAVQMRVSQNSGVSQNVDQARFSMMFLHP